jgi:HEAT repeat protein/lysophospholipase L1-like esterase
MLKRLAVHLAPSVAVAALCLALAEDWARKREVPRPQRPLADTRGLDWEAVWEGDFFVMKSTSTGWPSNHEYNRDGLRDRRHPREKLAGAYRLVALGDSVTFGYAFAREQSWPRILERTAAERGPGVEVLSVALLGWSTRQQRYAYERIARGYAPDTVVLAICLNDVEDLHNNLSRPPRLLRALFRRSALVRRLVDAEGREIASVEEMFETPESPRVRAGYERLFEEIRLLRRLVEDDGARLVLMVLPDADQVGPRPHRPVPQDRMRAFAGEEGLPFVDPLPALAAVGPSAFVDRLHLTPAGSAAVARVVLESAVPAEAWDTAELFAALGPSRDPGSLVPLLSHPSPAIRRQAAEAIARGGGSGSAMAALTARLRDDDASVRAAAARALASAGRWTEAAEDALFMALDDASETVRWAAADALAAGDLRSAESALRLAGLLDSPDTYIRGFAAWSLNHAGTAAVVAAPNLVARAQDADAGVRALAVRALGNLGVGEADVVAALARTVAQGTDEDRWRAARALAKLGPVAAPAVDALTRALEEDDARLRREAAASLARIGAPAEPALPVLIAARHDADPAVRDAAEKAIRRITAREE